MRRSSGYTRSTSCAKAASSPLLQAFNRLVTSAEGASMDRPVPLWDKSISEIWPLSPPVSAYINGRRDTAKINSSDKQESRYEKILVSMPASCCARGSRVFLCANRRRAGAEGTGDALYGH